MGERRSSRLGTTRAVRPAGSLREDDLPVVLHADDGPTPRSRFVEPLFKTAVVRHAVAVSDEEQCVCIGCSAHSVPSLSNTAMRSGGGTKSGEFCRATRSTKATIDFFGPVSFQKGSGSPTARCIVDVWAQPSVARGKHHRRTSHSQEGAARVVGFVGLRGHAESPNGTCVGFRGVTQPLLDSRVVPSTSVWIARATTGHRKLAPLAWGLPLLGR